MLDYFHIQVTRLRELHNNTQGLARFLIKCLFVCNYIRMSKIKHQHMNFLKYDKKKQSHLILYKSLTL